MDMVIATIKGAKTYICTQTSHRARPILMYCRRLGDAHDVGLGRLLVKRISLDLAKGTLSSIYATRCYSIFGQFATSLCVSSISTYLDIDLSIVCVVFYSTTWTEGACKSIHHFQPIAYAFLQMLCQAAFIYITWELLGQFCLSLLLATCFVIELVILAIGITRFEPYVMPPQAHNGKYLHD